MTPQKSWFEYATTEVEGLEHLAGRVVVQFARSFRASYLHGSRYAERLVVAQILEDKMSTGRFSGLFISLTESFDQLRHIVDRNLEAWRAALKSVAGSILFQRLMREIICQAVPMKPIDWAAGAPRFVDASAQSRAKGTHRKAGQRAREAFPVLHLGDLRRYGNTGSGAGPENHWKTALRSREFGYNSN